MLDRFNRRINYLRISVTDRCNLRCSYCMPTCGVTFLNHNDILRYEEIRDVVKVAVNLGIDKVRVTGGEPLVRKGIVSFIEMLSSIKGIKDLSMTTNGILLEKYANDLKKAGLSRINVSLDTINRSKYSEITRGGNLDDVIKGLIAAKDAGFNPIKINCVIKESKLEEDALQVEQFALLHNFVIRFIRLMNMEKGEFWPVDGGDGGNCSSCNRLRLSSDGKIYPCLFGDHSYSVRELGIEKAFEMALSCKPESGHESTSKFHLLGG